jgi:GMP synthase-like glutamine amidotransferase
VMKSLVINCSLDKGARIEELLAAVGKFSEVSAVRFDEVTSGYEVEGDVDAVVLSGSKARIVDPKIREQFRVVVDSVKRFDLPVLGMCFGHQLLCWSLGCEVDSLSEPVIGVFEEVRVVEPDEIFCGFEKNQLIHLAESHFDYVLKRGLSQAGLVLLADSRSCEVEAVNHKKKPFYGVQFHPELIRIENQEHLEGQKVFENFFHRIVRR